MRLLFIYLFSFGFLLGQTKLDSVLSVIKDKPDTIKIRILDDLCWKDRSDNPPFALECGEKALEFARKINAKNFEAKTSNLVGVIYRGRGYYDRSLSYFIHAMSIAEECRDSVEIGYSENNIGATYRLKGYNSLALTHVLNGLKIFERLNNKKGIAFCDITIGYIYLRQNNLPKAFEYFDKCYKIRREIKDLGGEAIALTAIATLYFQLGNFEASLDKWRQLEKQYIASNDKGGLISTWGNIGSILIEKQNYNQALKYNQRALALAEQIGTLEGEVTARRNIGLSYAYLGMFKEAKREIEKALASAVKFDDKFLMFSCYKALSKSYEIEGDLKSALHYSQIFANLKDSVLTQENLSGVNELETIYKNEKTLKENALLQKNMEFSETQRKYWIIISLLLILSSVVIYGRYHFKNKANKHLRELNAMKDKFFGIIAHDLRNPLHTILGSAEVLLDDIDGLSKEEIRRLVKGIETSGKQTYKLLENLLYWSMAQTGRLEFHPKEFDLTNMIYETFELLQSSAEIKNISLVCNTQEKHEVNADAEMVKTILRNLVSNGIKYTDSGGSVSINLSRKKNSIEVSVEDTGIGITEDLIRSLRQIENLKSTLGTQGEKGTGLGLLLSNEFIERNGGRLSIESKAGQGSKFLFTLPIPDNKVA